MSADQKWIPTHIEIEPSFDAFVPTFREGQLIRNLMTNKRGQMPLNADYLFAADNAIVELKCLEKNPMEASDWPPRLSKAFRATGHNFSDLMGYLVRGEPMPDTVRAKLVHWLRDAVRTVIKGGNRQIRASKSELGKMDAKGVLLVANDNNYGFRPEAMVTVIGDAVARLDDNHIDAVVYLSVNVFHRKPGSDVAWLLWEPRYRDETDIQLSEFVNDLGRRWYDHLEVASGDPFVERLERPQSDISGMEPVRRLGRAK
jgi:hypothetical protein